MDSVQELKVKVYKGKNQINYRYKSRLQPTENKVRTVLLFFFHCLDIVYLKLQHNVDYIANVCFDRFFVLPCRIGKS